MSFKESEKRILEELNSRTDKQDEASMLDIAKKRLAKAETEKTDADKLESSDLVLQRLKSASC